MNEKIHTIIPAEPGTYLLEGECPDYIKTQVIAWALSIMEDGGVSTHPVVIETWDEMLRDGDTLILMSDGQVTRLDAQVSWDSLEQLISSEKLCEREQGKKDF